MNAFELIQRLADRFIEQNYHVRGAPAGFNGPHLQNMTGLRLRSHWLVLLSRLFTITGDSKYRNALESLLAVTVEESDFRDHTIPLSRISTGTDRVNGLIGPAWILEGLVHAGNALGRGDVLSTANELATSIIFDEGRGLWHTTDIDGQSLGENQTLNQQIWLAYVISLNPETDTILKDRLSLFLDGIGRHLRFDSEGYLHHALRPRPFSRDRIFEMSGPIFGVASAVGVGRRPTMGRYAKYRDVHRIRHEKKVGYLIFSLRGLAGLAYFHPESGTLAKAAEQGYATVLSKRFANDVRDNQWAYPYNAPGFEFPIVAKTLKRSADLANYGQAFLHEQVRRHIEADGLKIVNTPDPDTLKARAYALSLLDQNEMLGLEFDLQPGTPRR